MTRTALKTAAKTATKTYIDVAYKDRDMAKRLGARWDASVKRWYCPAGSTLALIYKWRKAPTPAELAVEAPIAADPTPLEAAATLPDLVTVPAPEPAPKAATVAKIVRARIARMPQKRASRPISNDLFANLELPLAG